MGAPGAGIGEQHLDGLVREQIERGALLGGQVALLVVEDAESADRDAARSDQRARCVETDVSAFAGDERIGGEALVARHSVVATRASPTRCASVGAPTMPYSAIASVRDASSVSGIRFSFGCTQDSGAAPLG
ncbi:hypothetical protein ITJ43_04085 [Microbacterium sp. VKM Ac-2870]|uniref:hypothetical protein n=1 Tax=Microbacterium sp. VKM Ac-2870 TaxID=2783825 RepID=UPI001A01E728|nr:hypothetical protein [Microbacterium sp. VKM Ac-2870]MBF4561306.1 hypothetical protein [Microbacterium sp. VKM Ac-2870]